MSELLLSNDTSAMALAPDGMQTAGRGGKLISRSLAGLLIAAAVMAGVYAVAATAASTLAAGFTTTETSRHARSVEFEAAVKHASAEHRKDRAKCERLTGTKKRICNAVAPKRTTTMQSASNEAPMQW